MRNWFGTSILVEVKRVEYTYFPMFDIYLTSILFFYEYLLFTIINNHIYLTKTKGISCIHEDSPNKNIKKPPHCENLSYRRGVRWRGYPHGVGGCLWVLAGELIQN